MNFVAKIVASTHGLKTKKVLFVILSQSYGGAEKITGIQVIGLKRLGFELSVLLPKTGSNEGFWQELNTREIECLEMKAPIDTRFKALFSIFWSVVEFLLAYMRIKPEFSVFVLPSKGFGNGQVLAGSILNVPGLVMHQLFNPDTAYSKIESKFWRWIANSKLKIGAVSDSNGHFIAEKLQLPFDSIEIIRNGLSIRDLASGDCPEKVSNSIRGAHKIDRDTIVITTVARLSHHKGHDIIIPAIPHLVRDNIKTIFFWVGDGEERENLERLLDDYGVSENVIITGWVENPLDYMMSSDLFLFPSRFEGLPLTLIETIQIGVPIIAAASPGVIDILNNGDTATLFRSEDPCDLLEKVRWALKNSSEIESRADRARKLIKEFSEERMVRDLENLINSQ